MPRVVAGSGASLSVLRGIHYRLSSKISAVSTCPWWFLTHWAITSQIGKLTKRHAVLQVSFRMDMNICNAIVLDGVSSYSGFDLLTVQFPQLQNSNFQLENQFPLSAQFSSSFGLMAAQ
jgi:hypothetical protein